MDSAAKGLVSPLVRGGYAGPIWIKRIHHEVAIRGQYLVHARLHLCLGRDEDIVVRVISYALGYREAESNSLSIGPSVHLVAKVVP